MKHKTLHLVKSLHPAKLSPIARDLLKDEAISGKLIIAAVVIALLAANSPLRNAYESLLGIHLNIGLGNFSLDYDLKHWINDGLMTFFFLVVGLELKRELISGELKEFKTAALPFAAAIGGMLVPALIFASINIGKDSMSGWAIPVATDIALAIGLLALLGRRISSSLRIFLLTLAIVDDILAVIIIALFYTKDINIWMILVAPLLVATIFIITKLKLMTFRIFVILGIIFWITVNASGVHPTIAGAILGLLAPLALMKGQHRSIAHRLETAAIPLSTLIIVPLFAFANTGIVLSFNEVFTGPASSISIGIILGLLLGKSLGVVTATWLMVKFGKLRLPAKSSWSQITGIGFLAGIGFTVSIFITELAYTNEQYINISKLSIFMASILSAIIGLTILRYASANKS